MVTLRKGDLTSRVATKLGGSRAQGEAALAAVDTMKKMKLIK